MSRTVVLVVLDSLRYDVFQSYVSRADSSKSGISRVVDQGVQFHGATATAPWSLPSHASMFTGVYPREHGAVNDDTPIAANRPTLIDVCNEAGMTTGCFTKNTFIRADYGFDGWDSRKEYSSTIFPKGISLTTDQVGLKRYTDSIKQILESGTPIRSGVNAAAKEFGLFELTDQGGGEIVQSAVEWLEDRPNEDSFLFFNFMDTHDPHVWTDGIRARLRNYIDDGHEQTIGHLSKEVFRGEFDPNDLDITRLKQIMENELQYVDRRLEEVWAALDRQDRADDSLVILCSDHGEAFGEEGYLYHTTGVVEPILRTPLVVSGPETEPRDIEKRVSLSWIYGTVRDYLGFDADVSLLEPDSYPELLGAEDTGRIYEKLDDVSDVEEEFLDKQVAVYRTADPTRKYVRIGEDTTAREIEPRGLSETVIDEDTNGVISAFEKGLRSVSSRQIELSDQVKEDLKDLGYI